MRNKLSKRDFILRYLNKINIDCAVTIERIIKITTFDKQYIRNILAELIEKEIFKPITCWTSDGNVAYMRIKESNDIM